MFESTFLRLSTMAQEGSLLVSKTLKTPVLLDTEEMESLFLTLEKQGPFGIYFAQGMCKKGEGKISKTSFLNAYAEYISYLKKGEVPPIEPFRPFFSSFLSISSEILYAVSIEEDYQLIKSTRPVLQLQMNHIHYSKEDHTFRSMAYGSESISWGIQFSYPQIFQDPKTQEIHQVNDSPHFPNTILFKSFQKWIREATLPTPFLIGEKRKNEPIRLGKKCFNWIGKHSQLSQKGIKIYGAS